jgi:hypothetical protein
MLTRGTSYVVFSFKLHMPTRRSLYSSIKWNFVMTIDKGVLAVSAEGMVGVERSRSNHRYWTQSSASRRICRQLGSTSQFVAEHEGVSLTIHPRNEPRKGVRLISMVGKDVELRRSVFVRGVQESLVRVSTLPSRSEEFWETYSVSHPYNLQTGP